MKLAVTVNDPILSNVGATGEFRIRNSAKAFKILSDGLYSNKIRAIVRELSCNAVDSHVAAGKENVPFEVHLPTMLEPWFSVKDFGIGLDNDQVTNIYTTYFESTKTDSNAFIGALGLGSKSPFSYTENFTVTAVKNGTKRIYSAFINEMGVPSIAEMSVELTDEPNGVEVKFAVNDKSDYQTFRNEARYVFTWFKNKPTITGVENFEHREMTLLEKDIVPGVSRIDDRTSYAIMGNISYPLNYFPEADKHLGSLTALLNCGLVLSFEIGELDFSASREQLSYVQLTIDSIRKKLELLNDNIYFHLEKKLNEIESEWEKAFFLQEKSRDNLYKAGVLKYIADTKFELYDAKSYNGLKSFEYALPDLEKRDLEISGFRTRNGSTSKINYSVEYKHNSPSTYKQIDIPVEKGVVIVLNDLKTGATSRARYHYRSMSTWRTVFVVSHSDKDIAVRQKEYDKVLAELHNPPLVVMASELEKPVSKRRVSSQGLMQIEVKKDKSSGSVDSYMWAPLGETIDDKETYYYVNLSNHLAMNKDYTSKIDLFELKALMDSCSVSDFSKIRIIGVRRHKVKEIEQLKNWVWFEDAIKKEASKITNAHLESLLAADMLDSYYNRVYTNTNVARLVGPNSWYSKYVSKYTSIKRVHGNVNSLIALCGKYGNTLHIESVKKKMEEDKKELYAKYPMLKHINSDTNELDVAGYIKLVDKMEKI